MEGVEMAKKIEKAAAKASDTRSTKNLTSLPKKKTAEHKKKESSAAPRKTAAPPAEDKTPKVKASAASRKKDAVKTAVRAAKLPAEKEASAGSAKKGITRVRKDEILKKLRLSKADKKFFYDLLMHARSAFGAQVQYHSDDALTRKDAAGERVGMATHMADLGTDNYRRDFELGLLSDGVDVLEMIDEALQRLEDSEYGICLDCGEPIPRKRLEAKPYAKYCTKCKSKREEMDETYYHRR